MIFYLNTSPDIPRIKDNIIILYPESWDDWFTYNTLYSIAYFKKNNKTIIGSLKIGEADMVSGQRRPNIPLKFEQLGNKFFSVGQDDSYYENIRILGDKLRDMILNALSDISFNDEIYQKALFEHVTKISLLRSVSKTSIEGQFRRLAHGDATLTPYKFSYYAHKHPSSESQIVMDFNVDPNSNPPTNIHVIIGRNGVGKTHLFNNMINILIDNTSTTRKFGRFVNSDENSALFANVISVSFSAFDETNPMTEKRDKTKNINYSYIGLKRPPKDDKALLPKSPLMLKNEFVKSLEKCKAESKTRRWIDALNILNTDPIFRASLISEVINNSEINDEASVIFNKLSSGHKIVLLTITKLIETVEERSLVLLDEPEGYLHPPLLSAFIRALSAILTARNAVAIIGTHSPVVLQEVPKSCAWKLRRQGVHSIAERPNIESFGENVGVLTQEIFGLEVEDSGFHKILRELANNSDSYEEAISNLDGQLGMEGKIILRNLF